jgi:hypothetical protein
MFCLNISHRNIPRRYCTEIECGIRILEERSACHPLLRHRSKQQVTVHYDPSNQEGQWGWVLPSSNSIEVVLSRFCIRMGRWCIAGTLFHELASLLGPPSSA